MVRKHPVDVTTVRRGPGAGAVLDERRLAVTLLAHPDAERIGEIAFLERRARLGRLEPELGPVRGGPRRPIGDPHVSRRSITIEADESGVVFLGPPAGVEIAVDGARPDGALRLDAERVERGAVIELGDRVAVLLHRRRAPIGDGTGDSLVGDSEAIDRLRGEIERVADLDAPVLLGGETGTGKELVARAIHAASSRARGPFVAVNVAAIPASMAASQLFGHARGAFTGASAEHEGFFARADRGTLFLDEVGEMAAEIQPVLLRALDDGEVWPLGAPSSRRVDVRVVAATDADLARRAADGQFRAPLLHRLAGYVIRLPPLAERRDDIARLLVHFLRAELSAAGEPGWLAPGRLDDDPWLGAPAIAALVRRTWPGNVRELRNAARQIVIGSRGERRARIDPVLGGAGAGPGALAVGSAPGASAVGAGPGASAVGSAPGASAVGSGSAASAVGSAPGAGGDAAADGERRAGGDAAADGERRADGDRAAGAGRAEISADELLGALRRHGWRTGAAAAALGISKTTLYALMERTPGVRKARDLTAEEIAAAQADADGDVDRMAELLRVSRRGLALRMGELLREGGRGRR